jgi:hypothetical protein
MHYGVVRLRCEKTLHSFVCVCASASAKRTAPANPFRLDAWTHAPGVWSHHKKHVKMLGGGIVISASCKYQWIGDYNHIQVYEEI